MTARPDPVRRVVIFGATSAIAQEAARQWVARGATVVLLGRNPEKLDTLSAELRAKATAPVWCMVADLDDLAAHQRLVADAWRLAGTVDAALIAHGVLPDQETCARDPGPAIASVHTNALSVLSLCTLLATAFERQGQGRLAVISSVAGDRGRQSNYVYGAAKGMVTRYLEGLRNRMWHRGVAVVTIKPGLVDTPMTAGFPRKGILWSSPARVGAGVVRAIDRRSNVVYLPWFWRGIMLVIRLIPEPVFKRLGL